MLKLRLFKNLPFRYKLLQNCCSQLQAEIFTGVRTISQNAEKTYTNTKGFTTDAYGKGKVFSTDSYGKGKGFSTDAYGKGKGFSTDAYGKGKEFSTIGTGFIYSVELLPEKIRSKQHYDKKSELFTSKRMFGIKSCHFQLKNISQNDSNTLLCKRQSWQDSNSFQYINIGSVSKLLRNNNAGICNSCFARNYRPYLNVNRSFAKDYSLSALYVSHTDTSRSAVVQVDLDLHQKFSDILKLDSNMLSRGMHVNVYELHSKYKQLQEIQKIKEALEQEREKTAEQIKTLLKQTPVDVARKQELVTYGREIREKLKPLAKDYHELEEDVIVDALKLPVDLHSTTPKETVILKELAVKPEFQFKPKSHVEIAEKTHSVIFSDISPAAYYLRNELATFSHDLLCEVDHRLQDHGLTPIVCPDMVRSVVMEGCGQLFDDPQHVYTIEAKPGDGESMQSGDESPHLPKTDVTMHLTGVSPMAFIAYLTKMNISERCLPLRYHSIGTSYSPKPLNKSLDYPNLLLAPQASVAELFGCGRSELEMEEIYSQYVHIMDQLYHWLGVPARMVQTPCSGLDLMESCRTEVQVWLPSTKHYHKVGSVSMWEDFTSRRLAVKHSHNINHLPDNNYVFTVHGTLLHMPTLLAAIMENYQTSNGHFDIPEHLLGLQRQFLKQ